MISSEHITGLILAGGRAQRMGGIDKGLIPFHGKPLIESSISRLKPQVSTILINANRSITKYSHYGYPVLMDETPDFSGPSKPASHSQLQPSCGFSSRTPVLAQM